MLFNSQIFLLVFLPLTVAAYYLAAANRAMRVWVLIAASLAFYGYWDVRLVPLLVGSVTFNWLIARLTLVASTKWVIAAGVAFNLGLLGIFKYADFAADIFAAISGTPHQPWNIVLPLGISFFTFQQISYLVERDRSDAPAYAFRDYFLYVCFFPQLIAGPIVRHNEIISQFAANPLRDGLYERIGRGLALLVVGLVKKVFIADELARIVDPVFATVARGQLPGGWDAWAGALGFSLQIYFDFSAYSDMAIGLALILGFNLPLNFNSPYKATSIRDFWRRWHITLSRFLRDYLYIPMGGNRHGPIRQAIALLLTMLLGGLWHGAGWTFVLWGGLHGTALVANHFWNRAGLQLPSILGWLATFSFVVVAFVVFRADSLSGALTLFDGLLFSGGVQTIPETKTFLLVTGALLVTLLLPNSQTLTLTSLPARPIFSVIGAVASLLVLIYVGTGQNAEFIYFQF